MQYALMYPVRILQKTMKFKQVLVEEPIPEDTQDAKQERTKSQPGSLPQFPQIGKMQPRTRKVKRYVGTSPADPQGISMTLDDVPPYQLLVPPVTLEHVMSSLSKIHSSVNPNNVKLCVDWANKYKTE
ncbi:MAG: hypothetical protein EZS28_027846 [Streblomastix strix]|uniref:Spastin/Vps4 C-terminal domain-containing protein n=1 Tax=Streblomastix strix TaxID=222440 RepID=A0A5J4V1M4_9EUKA|nr:MAG: hypothetical protein EZS28_027846 [Streblomastix strix]